MINRSRDHIIPMDDEFLPDEVRNEYRAMAGLPPLGRRQPRKPVRKPSKRSDAINGRHA